MQNAFVLINCDIGYEKPVIENLKQLDDVGDIHGIFGPYDIIAKIQTKKTDSFFPTIIEQIRQINHVTSTLTLLDTDENIEPEKNGDDLIPDIIPDEKKPLEPPDEAEQDEDEEDENLLDKKS